MRKLITIFTVCVMAMLLLVSLAQANDSTISFTGDGSLYTFCVGSEGTLTIDSNMDTVYCDRTDSFSVSGDSFISMQNTNGYTVDRVVVVYNGSAQFAQSYSEQGDYLGSFGSSLSSDQIGVLWSSGFSSGVLAYSSYMLNQWAERSNPLLGLSTEFTLYSLTAEGSGYSQMSANLYEDWAYCPQPNIIAWTDEDTETGFSFNEKITSEDDGVDVELVARWTTSIVAIESFISTSTGI